MVSDVIYGRNIFRSYFDEKRFEDIIYNRVSEREKRIKYRKKLKKFDKLIIITLSFFLIILLVIHISIGIKIYKIGKLNNDINKLYIDLNKKKYDNDNSAFKMKTEIKFDDLKKIAYMELNMITPTEKNIIYFDKSNSGFVRQYENIR